MKMRKAALTMLSTLSLMGVMGITNTMHTTSTAGASTTSVKLNHSNKDNNKLQKHSFLSSADGAAKKWIAHHESSNSYHASNGKYYGKYQLGKHLLKGNYSASNQERVANKYVHQRYGTWQNAKSHWVKFNWY